MDVQLFRIDDRLIHGQVVIGWAGPMKSRRIILCDDEVSVNQWECELFCSCVPSDIETMILDAHNTTEVLSGQLADRDRTIVLVKDPKTVISIVNNGYRPGIVNVGGIHHVDGRSKYLPYLYMSENELQDLRWLNEQGVRLYCQDVPSGRRYEWTDLIKIIG